MMKITFISLELPETSVSMINICIYATVYRLFTSSELVNSPVPRLSRMTRLYDKYPLTTACMCIRSVHIIFVNAYSCASHIERNKDKVIRIRRVVSIVMIISNDFIRFFQRHIRFFL